MNIEYPISNVQGGRLRVVTSTLRIAYWILDIRRFRQFHISVHRIILPGFLSMAWALPAQAQMHCVVCSEPVKSGTAVVLDVHAYPVHEYSCKVTWQRALDAGLLDTLEHPIQAGDPVFRDERILDIEVTGTTAPTGYIPFWIGYVALVCTTSGLVAMLMAKMTNRSRLGAFALGFLVPAIGMVLVPILPERKLSTRKESETEGAE